MWNAGPIIITCKITFWVIVKRRHCYIYLLSYVCYCIFYYWIYDIIRYTLVCLSGVFIFFVYIINNLSIENGNLRLRVRGYDYHYVIGYYIIIIMARHRWHDDDEINLCWQLLRHPQCLVDVNYVNKIEK